MSEQKHTQEPMYFSRAKNGRAYIWDANNEPIAILVGDKKDLNARRIVACVNACAGIPTEALEGANTLNEVYQKLAQQRDELLAALKEFLESELTPFPSAEEGREAQDKWADSKAAARNNASFLIAKVESK